ncbi:MAG: CarD family transcriptional regulator [Christensenellales bacterium]|jgi:CarD family transcriptional regulator
MYTIGDRVSYPMHGAGIIEDIEQREMDGEINQYYVLKFALGDMKVMVPVKNVQDVGLREIITVKQYEEVMRCLGENGDDPSLNWNRRYRENLDKMRTGNIFDVAEVVRSLTLRDRRKGLSTGERKMLGNASQILLSELVLVSGMCEEEVKQCITDAICEDECEE